MLTLAISRQFVKASSTGGAPECCLTDNNGQPSLVTPDTLASLSGLRVEDLGLGVEHHLDDRW